MTGPFSDRPGRGFGLTDRFDDATARHAACLGKDAFATRSEARRVLLARQRRSSSPTHPHKGKRKELAKVQIYSCKFCGQWHFGVGNRR